MTCCIAALSAENSAIVMVSDQLLGFEMIMTEPETPKSIQIHPNWWLMYAGNGIEPVFPIADRIAAKLAIHDKPTISQVEADVASSFQEQQLLQAEAYHLKPRGLSIRSFHELAPQLPNELVTEIYANLYSFELPIELLVAGFDTSDAGKPKGYVLTLDGRRMTTRRHDNPGYAVIGSGTAAAMYWMAYRHLSYKTPVREAIYSVIEGKYFAELSSGVGEYTDAYIIQANRDPIRFTDERVDRAIIEPLCKRLSPRDISNPHRKVLNEIVELHGFPLLEIEESRRKRSLKVASKEL